MYFQKLTTEKIWYHPYSIENFNNDNMIIILKIIDHKKKISIFKL